MRWLPKSLSRVVLPSLCALIVCLGATYRAQATAVSSDAWIEMAVACENVVSMNSASGLARFPASTDTILVDGLDETSVQHPSGGVALSAAKAGSDWFLCVVRSIGVFKAGDLDTLVGVWAGHQHALAKANNGVLMTFDDGSTFAPVRVVCRANDQVTVVMAFLAADTNDFRIAATDRLPGSIDNPCDAGGSQ